MSLSASRTRRKVMLPVLTRRQQMLAEERAPLLNKSPWIWLRLMAQT